MRKRSKSILAIMLAASVMSGTGSLPVVAADFEFGEILEVEENSGGETGVFQETDNPEVKEDQESNSEEGFFTEAEIEEESVETCTGNEPEQSETGIPEADFSDEDTADVGLSGDYGVKVAGIWVTSGNKDDILGDGTVSYDVENRKLTLNNAHISSMTHDTEAVIGLIYFSQRVLSGGTAELATLELKGNNIIDVKESDKETWGTYITSVDDLVITGGGSLTVENNHSDTLASSNQSLIIDNVAIKYDMEDDGDENNPFSAISGSNIEIRNKAKLNFGKGSIRIESIYGNFSISDSELTCEGQIGAQKCSITDHSVLKTTNRIVANKAIEIWDSEVELKTQDKWGFLVEYLSGDERASFDIINSKVTIDAGIYPFYFLKCDLNIKNSILKADNSDFYSIKSQEAGDSVTIEESWVDLGGKIETLKKNISNSVVIEYKSGKVTGNAVVSENVEIKKDCWFQIKKPNTLTISKGYTLTVNGTVDSYCTGLKGKVAGNIPDYTHEKWSQIVNDKKYHWVECTGCGIKADKESHRYGAWKIYRNASVGVTGEREHSCKICNYAESGTIAALKVVDLKLKGGNKAVTLSWNKISGADGYKIYGTQCNKKSKLKKTAGKSTVKWTEKKLKAGTYYKYYVVAYKKVNGKETIIGKSDVMHVATTGKGYGYTKKINLKSTSITLKKGKSAYVKASLVSTSKKYNKTMKEHNPSIRYISSAQAVATVNSKGKVTARGKGTCYIYCYGVDGVSRKVKITVK